MVYQDTPQNVIMVFTDKIVSLALPTQDMIEQYGSAIKEMESFVAKSELVDDFENDPLSLDDFLRDMENESSEIDSDTDGMTIN